MQSRSEQHSCFPPDILGAHAACALVSTVLDTRESSSSSSTSHHSLQIYTFDGDIETCVFPCKSLQLQVLSTTAPAAVSSFSSIALLHMRLACEDYLERHSLTTASVLSLLELGSLGRFRVGTMHEVHLPLSSLDACSDIERVRAEACDTAIEQRTESFWSFNLFVQLPSGDLPAPWTVFRVVLIGVLVSNVSSGVGVLGIFP